MHDPELVSALPKPSSMAFHMSFKRLFSLASHSHQRARRPTNRYTITLPEALMVKVPPRHPSTSIASWLDLAAPCSTPRAYVRLQALNLYQRSVPVAME